MNTAFNFHMRQAPCPTRTRRALSSLLPVLTVLSGSVLLSGCGITPPPVPEGDRIPINFSPAPKADTNHLVSSSGDCITTGSLGLGSSNIVCPEEKTPQKEWGVQSPTIQNANQGGQGPVGGYSSVQTLPVETHTAAESQKEPAAPQASATPAQVLQPAEPAVLTPVQVPGESDGKPESAGMAVSTDSSAPTGNEAQ